MPAGGEWVGGAGVGGTGVGGTGVGGTGVGGTGVGGTGVGGAGVGGTGVGGTGVGGAGVGGTGVAAGRAGENVIGSAESRKPWFIAGKHLQHLQDTSAQSADKNSSGISGSESMLHRLAGIVPVRFVS